jgi:hypothetical protein
MDGSFRLPASALEGNGNGTTLVLDHTKDPAFQTGTAPTEFVKLSELVVNGGGGGGALIWCDVVCGLLVCVECTPSGVEKGQNAHCHDPLTHLNTHTYA